MHRDHRDQNLCNECLDEFLSEHLSICVNVGCENCSKEIEIFRKMILREIETLLIICDPHNLVVPHSTDDLDIFFHSGSEVTLQGYVLWVHHCPFIETNEMRIAIPDGGILIHSCIQK